MLRFKKTLIFLLVLLAFAATWAVGRLLAKPPPAQDLRISTGTSGGTYFTAG